MNYREINHDQLNELIAMMDELNDQITTTDPCEICHGGPVQGDHCAGCQMEDPAVQTDMELDPDPVFDDVIPGIADQAPAVPVVPVARIEMTADRYKEMIASLGALVTDCRLKLSPDGITVRAVDTANVAMIDMELTKGYFESFQAPDHMEIGIDVLKMKKYGSMVKKGDLVSLSFSGQKMTFEGAGTTINETTLDPNTIRRDPNRPTIDLKVVGQISAGAFMQGVKDTKQITDKIALVSDGSTLVLMGEGETNKIKKSIPWIGSAPGMARSLFSIEYLYDMVRTFNKKEEITIRMGEDYPVDIIRENVSGIPGTRIEYLLAPRIEAD